MDPRERIRVDRLYSRRVNRKRQRAVERVAESEQLPDVSERSLSAAEMIGAGREEASREIES